MTIVKRKSKSYLDNAAFYQALKDYKVSVNAALENGKPKPRVPEFIGACMLKIATNFATRPEYNRYPYIDDMICDAVIQCIKYLDTFDPDRSKSAFSYFTQCCYHSFIHRIALERKQLYIKIKSIVDLPVEGNIADTVSDDHSMDNVDVSFANMHEFIGEYEKKNNISSGKRKRKSNQPIDDNVESGLQSFLDNKGD